MRVIGLTGGIGSGKSLAAEFFADLGALVIDADQLARAAIERGSKGLSRLDRQRYMEALKRPLRNIQDIHRLARMLRVKPYSTGIYAPLRDFKGSQVLYVCHPMGIAKDKLSTGSSPKQSSPVLKAKRSSSRAVGKRGNRTSTPTTSRKR